MPESSIDARGVHRVFVALRWGDFDRYGHLNNARFADLAQEARVRWAFDQFHRRGLPIPAFFVRHTELDFLRPITPMPDNRVPVESTVSGVGTTSLTVRQRILDGRGDVACIVETVMVAMDQQTFRPREITRQELNILTQGAAKGGAPGEGA